MSVLGTGTYIINPSSFSWKLGVYELQKYRYNLRPRFSYTIHGFAYEYTFTLRPKSINRLPFASFVTPSVI